jgi:hypothetical protein
MVKQLITATLFALGVAGIALVGYLSAERLAFTRPVRELPSVGWLPAVIPASVPVGLDSETNPTWLAEVQITATPPRARKPSTVPVVPVRFDPCSEWRDVGALFVDSTGATGVRNVRALCVKPDVDR